MCYNSPWCVAARRKSNFRTYAVFFLYFYFGGQKMQQKQRCLATEKIGRLMGRYAVPCVIQLLAGRLYNIVDQMSAESGKEKSAVIL